MSKINATPEYLIIAGTPKSGSTYLFNLLASHPNICPAATKETHYFLSPEHPLVNPKQHVQQGGLSGFASFFDPSSKDRFLLEASVQLFSDETAPTRLQALQDLRLLFIFRSPAERVRSSFYFSKNNLALFKKSVYFADFVSCLLQQDRMRLKSWLHKDVSEKVLLSELDTGNYSRHLARWKAAFRSDQIHIIQYEQLLQFPNETIATTCRFLDVERLTGQHFKKADRNATQSIKAHRFHYLVKSISAKLPKVMGKTLLKKAYYKLQTKEKVTLSDEDRIALEQLKAYYEPFNKQLCDLPEIDLLLW